MELADVRTLAEGVRSELARVVVGQERAVDLMLVALLTQGHVLLEGPPGVGKTLLVRAFAGALHLRFNRVQFTPDLMPGDLLGANVFDFRTGQFALTKGPVFTDVLLADELNRTPPKTQAALLQAMQERETTLDGVTHALGAGFMVAATQNPLENEGVYPLPEAQLDRFLFKIDVGYPSLEEERDLVRRHGRSAGPLDVRAFGVTAVADLDALIAARAAVAAVRLEDPVADYVVDVVRATRERDDLRSGASPRAAATLAAAARARAALAGRDYALPDDVQELAPYALAHRVILAPTAELEGRTASDVIASVLQATPVPR
ncbi:MAG TPA: MoxR family ATPase [Planctomycetota bacterium]|nr:MoxR family ATPase [Planctomycetota bacterium]